MVPDSLPCSRQFADKSLCFGHTICGKSQSRSKDSLCPIHQLTEPNVLNLLGEGTWPGITVGLGRTVGCCCVPRLVGMRTPLSKEEQDVPATRGR